MPLAGLISRQEAKDPASSPGRRTPFFGCLQAGWGPIQQDLADTVTCLSTSPYIPCFLPDDNWPGWDPPSHLCHPSVLPSHSFTGSHLVTPGPFKLLLE